MKLTDGDMGVVDAFGVVFLEDASDAAHVVGEGGDGDGGVFDEGDGFDVARGAHEEAEAGFSEVPDLTALVIIEDGEGVAEILIFKILDNALAALEEGFLMIMKKFDDKNGLWLAL